MLDTSVVSSPCLIYSSLVLRNRQSWKCISLLLPLLLPAACRSLGVLVRKVGEARVMELVKGLCEKVAAPSKKDSSSRDIASIGLKTVIEVAGGSLAHPAAALICSRMLDGVTQKVRGCRLEVSVW